MYLSIPVTAGAVAGGVMVLAAPWLALIAAIAGVVAKVKPEIVRDVPPQVEDGAPEDTGSAPLGGD